MGGLTFLRVHSCYSFLAGTASPERIVEAAAERGARSVALTDTDGLFAVLPFYRACLEKGIRPVIGSEITGERGRVTLLARNIDGYSEISRLATARRLEDGFSLPERVRGVSDNLYVLSDDPEILGMLKGRDFIRAALPLSPGTAGRRKRYRLKRFAENAGLASVAAGPVYFPEREDYYIHRLLRAIGTGKTVGTLLPGDTASRHAFLHSRKELERIFTPETLAATEEVASDCHLELDLQSRRLPAFPLPENRDSSGLLREIALAGLEKRGLDHGRGREQLEHELSVVNGKGLADYFLICWDVVSYAAERGMRSLGRGSAGNSLLSYVLGITHVDPLESDLFFERFLNPGRDKLPDIDIDFATEDREKVLQYIFRKYGSERVAMIGTYSTFRARGAIRETAKALGIPESEISPMIRRIPFFARMKHLRETCRGKVDLNGEPLRSVLPAAAAIEGLPRHMSAHPCGLVITPMPVTDMIPLQICRKGYRITQWSMDEVEEAGFLKLDIIGQKGLAVIQDAAALAGRDGGFDPASRRDLFSGNGPAARMLREGRTVGCFYVESPVMIQMLRQARCEDFETLTALSSIIRPGVSSYGGKELYLSRHLGLEPAGRIDPVVDRVLEGTYGCLIYQEQVIRLAVEVSGMSYAEADGLRRCMSYKSGDNETMAQYRRPFVRGALEKGVSEETAQAVFDWIASFSGYAFCKAHSASFAMESLASVYWKANYPAEFMAAVIANGGGYYHTGEYVEEARRMGVRIEPPCVNRSSAATRGGDDRILIGLRRIKGLTASTAESIVENRPYSSLADFKSRVRISDGETESLIRCGAMRSFGASITRLLWERRILEAGESRGQAGGRAAGAPALQLMERRSTSTDKPPGPYELIGMLPEMDGSVGLARRVAMEMEVLGFAASAHPLAVFQDRISRLRERVSITSSRYLDSCEGEYVNLVGWKVSTSPTRTVDERREMLFVTFSDMAGRYETVFFPDSCSRLSAELARGPGPFLVSGRVQSDFGVENLVVRGLKSLL
ncbi:MAG: DNA polymerase III subunit alpha [Candidatus Latescibacteria bacterium]|nr:DNA polymerase III subunit alpha [bacterium]MBD3423415.1 DNA polymerase III subunit alpha [Candidatus Latescibacterota bacterium]